MDEWWRFEAVPWAHDAGSWVFVTVPEEVAEGLRAMREPGRGFGSVRVEATCGATTWTTSVFPGASGFDLPLKRAVRRAAGIEVGEMTRFGLRRA